MDITQPSWAKLWKTFDLICWVELRCGWAKVDQNVLHLCECLFPVIKSLYLIFQKIAVISWLTPGPITNYSWLTCHQSPHLKFLQFYLFSFWSSSLTRVRCLGKIKIQFVLEFAQRWSSIISWAAISTEFWNPTTSPNDNLFRSCATMEQEFDLHVFFFVRILFIRINHDKT